MSWLSGPDLHRAAACFLRLLPPLPLEAQVFTKAFLFSL